MKRFRILTVVPLLVTLALSVGVLNPQTLWACACGCGVFEVGTSAMFPTHLGGMAFLEWDYQNQNRNRNGTSWSSADNNADKEIRTNFFTLGYQYMVNQKWGYMAELPYSNRYFKTTDDNGDVVGFEHSAVGDIRIQGIYAGFSGNMSTGLTFGLKLPSGDYTYPHFDPDTELGTGSTDLLLGAYHMSEITNTNWDLFADGKLDQPVLNAGGYRPGSEIDAAAGTYYDNWKLGNVKVAPLAQVIGSVRWADSGTLGHSQDSGFERILLAPGIELDMARIRIYGDVGFPVYQRVNCEQLVASELFKLNVSYHF